MIYLQLALAFLRGNWRWMLPLAGCLAVLAILAYARHANDVARHATQAAKVAQQQTQAEHRATQSVERTAKREAALDQIANEETAHVLQLPDANTTLDPDRRAQLCASLERVHHHPICGDPGPVSGALPGPDNRNGNAG